MYKYDISTMCYVSNCGLNFEEKDFETVIKNVLLCMIDVFDANYKNDTMHDIIDLYQKYEVIEMFRREIISFSGNKVIDMLFDGIDFEKFTQETIEFYQDILVIFLCEFFGSYIDKQRRNICKNKIKYIEEKIINIANETVRIQLYKSLILSVRRNCCWDLKKCKITYSYADKHFLNEQFAKYGKYHLKELFATIYQLNLDELLPDILVSVSECFKCAVIEKQNFNKILTENDLIINMLILKPFLKYSDEIKQNEELTNAYEGMLKILIDLNYEKAAVILDEFRIH